MFNLVVFALLSSILRAASILRADMKYGKRLVLIDETRRETYKQFHPSTFSHEPSSLSDLDGDTKQLMPVRLIVYVHSIIIIIVYFGLHFCHDALATLVYSSVFFLYLPVKYNAYTLKNILLTDC